MHIINTWTRLRQPAVMRWDDDESRPTSGHAAELLSLSAVTLPVFSEKGRSPRDIGPLFKRNCRDIFPLYFLPSSKPVSSVLF